LPKSNRGKALKSTRIAYKWTHAGVLHPVLVSSFHKRSKKLDTMWKKATQIIGNLGKGPCSKRLKGFGLLSLIKTSSNDFSDYNGRVSPQGENTEQQQQHSHLRKKGIMRGDSWK